MATPAKSPIAIAHHLGITPTYVDGTNVGGCSFMLHVRHAAAAINAGLCKTVLITHGESGRSSVGARGRGRVDPAGRRSSSCPTALGPPTLFTSAGAALHEEFAADRSSSSRWWRSCSASGRH